MCLKLKCCIIKSMCISVIFLLMPIIVVHHCRIYIFFCDCFQICLNFSKLGITNQYTIIKNKCIPLLGFVQALVSWGLKMVYTYGVYQSSFQNINKLVLIFDDTIIRWKGKTAKWIKRGTQWCHYELLKYIGTPQFFFRN